MLCRARMSDSFSDGAGRLMLPPQLLLSQRQRA
jgi:hypothetical protein